MANLGRDFVITSILRLLRIVMGEVIDVLEGRGLDIKRVEQAWPEMKSALAKLEAEENRKRKKREPA